MKSILAQGRFALFPALMAITLVMTAAGGVWIWIAAAILFLICPLGDEAAEAYHDRVDQPNPAFLSAVLYTAPVLTVAMTGIMLLYAADAQTPMGDLAARLGLAQSGVEWWLGALGAVFATGMLTAFAAVAYGHELIHRGRRLDWLIGQALCARCLHPSIAIDHVFGHHLAVGTPCDASTAPRGMGFWRYVVRAIIWENRSAVTIERRRLRRRGLPFLTLHNRVLQGFAMLAAFLALVHELAGWTGLAAFVVSGINGLIVFDLGNYVSHYGLVRVPGTRVEPRHSWNAPRLVSTSILINIPRHSHHHASAGAPYWILEVMDDAPIQPYGWGVMALSALVPPVWFRIMGPSLEKWDATLASPEELLLLGR